MKTIKENEKLIKKLYTSYLYETIDNEEYEWFNYDAYTIKVNPKNIKTIEYITITRKNLCYIINVNLQIIKTHIYYENFSFKIHLFNNYTIYKKISKLFYKLNNFEKIKKQEELLNCLPTNIRRKEKINNII